MAFSLSVYRERQILSQLFIKKSCSSRISALHSKSENALAHPMPASSSFGLILRFQQLSFDMASFVARVGLLATLEGVRLSNLRVRSMWMESLSTPYRISA
jgi:hypothetical protein